MDNGFTPQQKQELAALIQQQAPNPNDFRAKPTDSIPTLRRRKADIEAEGHAWMEKMSADGYEATDEDLKKGEELTARQERARKILESAEKWQAVDDSDDNDLRGRIELLPHNDDKNTHNRRHNYSLMKVLRHLSNPRRWPLDGIEAEVDAEMKKMPPADTSKRRTLGGGISIPLDLPIDLNSAMRWAERSRVGLNQRGTMLETRQRVAQMRALDTTAGAGSIPTILDTTIIEILRARMVTYAMGARVMTDMQGLFAIPRQATASTFYMVGQGAPVTASNQTIDQVPFSPHTGGVNTQYTRQFLEQTNQDAEMFVREDQAAVVARGVETAALNGQGSLGYPLGIINNTQIGVYPLGTNGAAPNWTQIVSMEAYVAYFNADVGTLSYVTDALIRGTLKLTAKIGATFPIYLWNTEAPDFPVNGYPCPVTNLLPQNLSKGAGTNLHAMIFGNWEDLIYAFWSGMDVIVDPYTQAAQGAVNIITLQDFDVNVRHYQSFANCVDIISSITAPII
jgi:HK97 family phage major capsid protein